MYIYFKDKEICLNALASSTDKTGILKKYEDEYRLNAYDLTFKERSKFFYQFTKKEYLGSFKVSKEEPSKTILFLDHHLKSALSVYSDLLSKFKNREDVVVFINQIYSPSCLQLVFKSNGEIDKEMKYIHKIVNEEMLSYLQAFHKKIEVEEEGC